MLCRYTVSMWAHMYKFNFKKVKRILRLEVFYIFFSIKKVEKKPKMKSNKMKKKGVSNIFASSSAQIQVRNTKEHRQS